MSVTVFVLDYMQWHYKTAPAALFHIWLNIMRYTEQLFSIRLHAHTLFSPWHRIVDAPRKRFSLEEWAASTIVNLLSRLIGFVLRSVIIVVGLLMMVLLGIALVPALLVWYTAPLFIISALTIGVTLVVLSYGHTQ